MEAYRETFLARMWNVSACMKLLEQRITQWLNRTLGRKGTLWDERFKSVQVEGAGTARATMVTCIDMKPVRAGIVADPKDYRWRGHAATLAGVQRARVGLGSMRTPYADRSLRKRKPGANTDGCFMASARHKASDEQGRSIPARIYR